MRRTARATEMPKFVSHDEWLVIRRASVRKTAFLMLLGAGFLTGLVTLGAMAPGYLKGRSLAKLASWVRNTPNLHIVARQPKDGSLVFEEWADGDRFSLRRSFDGFRFVGSTDGATAVGSQFALRSNVENAPADPRETLADWIDDFASIRPFGQVQEIGSKTVEGRKCRGLQLLGRNVRVTLWVDPDRWVPVQVMKEYRTAAEWATAWAATLKAEKAPEAVFATGPAREETEFAKAAAERLTQVRDRVGAGSTFVPVRDFSIGRTGIVYAVVDLPTTVNGRSGQWQVAADDGLNGSYMRSALTEPLAEPETRSPVFPPSSTLLVFMPAARRPAFAPLTVSLTLTFSSDKSGEPPLFITAVERRFEAPTCDIAPDYIYAYRSVDRINRRLRAAQDLAWGAQASVIQVSEGRQRSPDNRLLMALGSDALTDILATNAESVGIASFERAARLTVDRLQHLHATGSIGYLGADERADAYDYLFPLEQIR
jgi:hypothetical protein